jgi:hypothetical protein
MHRMECIGPKEFEHGYWESGEDCRIRIKVLEIEEGNQLTVGIIQDGGLKKRARTRGNWMWTDDAMDVNVNADDAKVDGSSDGEDDEEVKAKVKNCLARCRY